MYRSGQNFPVAKQSATSHVNRDEHSSTMPFKTSKSLVAEHIVFARNQKMFFCHVSTLKMVKGEKWVLTVLSFEYHFMTLSKKFESTIAKEVLADQY